MKSLARFFSFLLVVSVSIQVIAQTPNAINYQGVVRDGNGQLLTNTALSAQFTIKQNGPAGSTVYRETHSITTNDYGLFTLKVGGGTVDQGSFSSIDWGNGVYYLKVEADPDGGLNFVSLSTTQLLSVPYALHAKTVDNADDADADPSNEFQTLTRNGTNIELSDGGGSVPLFDDDASNEIQTITKNGNTIELSLVGGSVTLDDDDATNELQTLSRTGDTVRLSQGGGQFIDQKNDADADPSNELQTISKSGNQIILSNGGGIIVDDINDADADAGNELQTLTRSGVDLTLSNGGGTINAPASTGLKYIICIEGASPPTSGTPQTVPMLGEIKLFAGSFAPAGWTFCEGQILPINNFPTLFSVIGTTYGGNGVSTFQLPDLTNKTAHHRQ